jgi:hypothetical protein
VWYHVCVCHLVCVSMRVRACVCVCIFMCVSVLAVLCNNARHSFLVPCSLTLPLSHALFFSFLFIHFIIYLSHSFCSGLPPSLYSPPHAIQFLIFSLSSSSSPSPSPLCVNVLIGTKYSIAKPGNRGRYEGELLLREDQLLSGTHTPRTLLTTLHTATTLISYCAVIRSAFNQHCVVVHYDALYSISVLYCRTV